MAVDAGYHDQIMDLLAPIGDVHSRAMFGGYGIFHEGDMFALISSSTLYFKVDDSNRALYEGAGSDKFGRMPYYEVPHDVFEEYEELHKWANISVAVGHVAATKKRRK